MNKENNIVDANTTIKFSNNFIAEIKELVSNGRRQAYAAVNNAMLTTYWQIGKRRYALLHEAILHDFPGDFRYTVANFELVSL